MRNHRRAAFNMVEIALAMAVIALGVISIMALFPVGLNANRDSMAVSYAADVGDQFVHQLEEMLRRPAGWTTYITGGGIPATYDAARADYFTGTVVPNTQDSMWAGPANTGAYRLLRYVDVNANSTYEEGTDILDFEAIVLVWQDSVTVPHGTGSTNLPASMAVALNVEISWPARLPHSQRQKTFFRKEVFTR